MTLSKKLLTFLVSLTCISSCTMIERPENFLTSNNYDESETATKSFDVYDNDCPIIIGATLENPYRIGNMREAYRQLSSQGITLSFPISNITVSHLYIKFIPSSIDELYELEEFQCLELFDYPLDCEIVQEGDYYRQPGIADSIPTWQYASVAIADWSQIKKDITVKYEILDSLCTEFKYTINKTNYLNDNTIENDFDILEQMSFKLTGNAEAVTKAPAKWRPSGRVMAYDNIVDGMIPLENVKVRTNRFGKVAVGYTNENGYYSCNKTYQYKVRYKIVWESSRWDIRDGNLWQAYLNDGGWRKGEWNVNILNGNGKSIRYATIHRALQRFYFGNTYGLSRPSNSRKEKVAYLHKESKNDINGDYNRQWGLGVWSDIRIFGISNGEYRDLSAIYSTTAHEVGHAAHFTNSRNNYKKSSDMLLESWARCVQAHLTDCEYSELGVKRKLYEYESLLGMVSPKKNRVEIADSVFVVMMTPDQQYNFQSWKSGSSAYTPLFIDLIDNYNQRTYYSLKYKGSNVKLSYPDDKVSGFPISDLENLVYASTSISGFRQKLENYIVEHPSIGNGMTEENLEILFESYE